MAEAVDCWLDCACTCSFCLVDISKNNVSFKLGIVFPCTSARWMGRGVAFVEGRTIGRASRAGTRAGSGAVRVGHDGNWVSPVASRRSQPESMRVSPGTRHGAVMVAGTGARTDAPVVWVFHRWHGAFRPAPFVRLFRHAAPFAPVRRALHRTRACGGSAGALSHPVRGARPGAGRRSQQLGTKAVGLAGRRRVSAASQDEECTSRNLDEYFGLRHPRTRSGCRPGPQCTQGVFHPFQDPGINGHG